MDLTIDQSTYWIDKDGDGEIDPDEIIVHDLTTRTGSSTTINGAIFSADPADGSSGTGLIQAFVRVQDEGNGDGVESGYNTDYRPLSYEENSSPSFTIDLPLSSVPVVVINGVEYYEFRLDINQLNSSPLLSLDALKLYISDADVDGNGLTTDDIDSAQGFIDGLWFTNNATLVYDMDDADLDGTPDTNNSVLLDYALQAGSGKSDMFFYVPVEAFNGADPDTTKVILYSEFGELGELGAGDAEGDNALIAIDADDDASLLYGDYSANDGFEEWSVSKELPGVDFTGYKWHDLDGDGVWDIGEVGLSGWQINYTVEYTITFKGNQNNNPPVTDSVTFSVITDENGQYTLTVPTFTDNNIASVDYTLTVYETLQDPDIWVNSYGGYFADPNIVGPTVIEFTDADIDGKGEDIDRNGDFGIAEPLNFGNYQYGSIEGTKLEDADGDGSTTDDQTAKEGWNIYLFSSDPGSDPDVSQADDSTTTDVNGDYSFDMLAPGTYWVVEETRDGWTNISPVTVDVGTQTSGFDVNDVDFVNFADMMISGYKWADIDADGTWNESDGAVLSGWEIVLDNDMDSSNGVIATATTNEFGYYEFTDLNPVDFPGLLDNGGTLYVYETQQDGFKQTYGGFTFDVTSGLVIEGALGATEDGNFGNNMLLGANRTPGFWQSTLGQSLYDGDDTNNGDANGDGVPDGDKDFEEEGWSTTDLLTKYGVDLLDQNGLPGSDGINDTFILWDENENGAFDQGEDIFLTAAELHEWVSGGKADEKGGLDGLEKLERDLGAAFLNTLNNHSLATDGSDSEDPQIIKTIIDDEIYDSYTAAVEFILEYDDDLDGEANNVGKGALQKKWKDDDSFGDHDKDGFIQNDGNVGITGSQAHNELSAFNENGEAVIEGEMTQILMDGDDYSNPLVQNYLALQEELLIQSGVVVEATTTMEDDMMIAQINAPL